MLALVFLSTIFFFLVLPPVLGGILDDTSFTISSMGMYNTSGASTSLSVEGYLYASIPLASQGILKAAKLEIWYEEAFVGHISTSDVYLYANVSVHHVNLGGIAAISNETAFTDMGIALFANLEIPISLRGEVSIEAAVLGINFQVPALLNKTIMVEGLGGNLDANVLDFDIDVSPDGLLVANINATLPNPTYLSVCFLSLVWFSPLKCIL